MDAITEIFHNPSFKKDVAFINQLEQKNTYYQEKIYKKFNSKNVQKEDHSINENSNFESHPSGFTSESDENCDRFDEDFKNESEIHMSFLSVRAKLPKDKKKSWSASKITLSDKSRKNLRKKLTYHLDNGTLNKFEIGKIGDSPLNTYERYKKKEDSVTEETERNSSKWSSIERNSSDICLPKMSKATAMRKILDKNSAIENKKHSENENHTEHSSQVTVTEAFDIQEYLAYEMANSFSQEELNEVFKKKSKKEKQEFKSITDTYLVESEIDDSNQLKKSEKSKGKKHKLKEKKNAQETDDIKCSNSDSIKETKNSEKNYSNTLLEENNTKHQRKGVTIQETPKKNKVETKNTPNKEQNGPTKTKSSSKIIKVTAELRKSRHYIEKSIGNIKDIGVILNHGPKETDGTEDYSRRYLRTKEFTSRFSRVYMYPLARYLSQLNAMSPSENKLNIYLKFTSIYQLVHQALQAFFNHVPTTVGKNSYEKLKDHLNFITEVCDKNISLFENGQEKENEEYVNILKSQCKNLICKLENDFIPLNDHSLKSKSTKLNLSNVNRNTSFQSFPTQGNLRQRLWMYNTPLATKRERQWERIIKNLKKKECPVKSRNRSTLKIGNVEKQQIKKNHRFDDGSSLNVLRNTPVATPLQDESIRTMIDCEKEHKNDYVNSNEIKNINEKNTNECLDQHINQHDDILGKLLELVQGNMNVTPENIDAKLGNTIKILQKCLSFKNENFELFKKMATENVNILTNNISKNTLDNNISDMKKSKESNIIVNGAKNVQLICIRDDTEESLKQNVPHNSPRQLTDIKNFTSPVIENNNDSFNSLQSPILIRNNLKKQKSILKLLPKKIAINIIDYKLKFHKYYKGDDLYRKIRTQKQWEVIDRISEDVLDSVLFGVAKEIEVNELLENMYRSEFNYYD